MTTLYDTTFTSQHDKYYNIKKEQEKYDIEEFDLDVVDDALLNPDSSEYIDHFGFKIHVRTDDESSSDEESDDETKQEKLDRKAHLNSSFSSRTTTTVTSDDDSIDTNLTTPHTSQHEHHEKWLSDKAQLMEHFQSLSTESTTTIVPNNQSQINTKEIKKNIPILKSPPSTKSDKTLKQEEETTLNIQSPIENQQVSSPKDTQSSPKTDNRNSNRFSILSSFNLPFSNRPISVSSTQSQNVIYRPSQSYQQRQSKRYSDVNSIMSISRPPTTHHRQADKLASKFKRFSHHDHQYNSENHLILKDEALAELEIYKEKGGTETNWDFWKLVIQDFGGVIESQLDDLRYNLTKGGMPSPIRGLLWQLIAKSHDRSGLENEYNELVKKPNSAFEKQIQRDLTRTFPNHPFFMQESGRQSLFNVAKAYSIFDQEVGYCQGLAFIIGCLLLHMSEEDTFCALIKLMGKYGLRGHFTPKMETLQQHIYQFDNVFQQKLPVVHRHLESEGVTPSMYASQWFITLFSYRCPIEISFRVIDLLLVEGSHVLIQIALCLMIKNQERIIKLSFERLIEFLCHGIFESFSEDGDNFVEQVYQVDLPAKFMARLAQQYTGEEENRSTRSISQEDNLRRINGQLSEHIRSAENQLQQLRTENQDITQQIINSKMDIARSEDEKQHLRHELNKIKADFEKYKKEMTISYENRINDLLLKQRGLEDSNLLLANQLTDTEAMLIDLKMTVAERESEFETLKRQLKDAMKI